MAGRSNLGRRKQKKAVSQRTGTDKTDRQRIEHGGKMMQEAINISAPNLINICIDSADGNEKQGRMYCFYKEEAIEFRNVHELFKLMGELMNGINYPQHSVKLRSYNKNDENNKYSKYKTELPEIDEREKILKNRGKKDTLVVYVRFRQKATWQGSVYYVDTGKKEDFYSELDLMKIIDNSTKTEKNFTQFI